MLYYVLCFTRLLRYIDDSINTDSPCTCTDVNTCYTSLRIDYMHPWAHTHLHLCKLSCNALFNGYIFDHGSGLHQANEC